MDGFVTERTAVEVTPRSGRVLRERVLAFERGAAGVGRLITDAGRHACDLVVLAGAWSRDLARSLGKSFPLIAERGYHDMIAEPTALPCTPVVVHGPQRVDHRDGL